MNICAMKSKREKLDTFKKIIDFGKRKIMIKSRNIHIHVHVFEL